MAVPLSRGLPRHFSDDSKRTPSPSPSPGLSAQKILEPGEPRSPSIAAEPSNPPRPVVAQLPAAGKSRCSPDSSVPSAERIALQEALTKLRVADDALATLWQRRIEPMLGRESGLESIEENRIAALLGQAEARGLRLSEAEVAALLAASERARCGPVIDKAIMALAPPDSMLSLAAER